MVDHDLPDLSTPYWAERFAKVKPSRGRPALPVTKVSTTLRLDPDILAAYRATGPGWQGRINADLRPAPRARAKLDATTPPPCAA